MTLALVRVSGMVLFAPFFSSTALPVRAKAVFALAIAWLLAPLVASLPRAHADINFTAILGELAVGLVYGLTLALLNEMLSFAGQIAGVQFSFSLVNLMDPSSSIETPLLGNSFQLMGTLVLITAGLDRILLASLFRSFRAVPLGTYALAPTAGLALVLIFMVVVYRLPGALADLALFVYVLMLLALLSVAHAVLTLPGIAGFVLSIGMAVDANVLIFERIKEELWAGKSLRAAVRIGFQRAFSSVFDSHFTTIVGAGVLYLLGTGTVKGFAYTLFWGTAFSLLTAVVITRFFMDIVVENNLATSKAAYGAGGDGTAGPGRSVGVPAHAPSRLPAQ